jgi:hypothetical protein
MRRPLRTLRDLALPVFAGLRLTGLVMTPVCRTGPGRVGRRRPGPASTRRRGPWLRDVPAGGLRLPGARSPAGIGWRLGRPGLNGGGMQDVGPRRLGGTRLSRGALPLGGCGCGRRRGRGRGGLLGGLGEPDALTARFIARRM